MKKLRVLHVVVQPVLVWDDGEDLSPGPELSPVPVSPSQLASLAESIPDQVRELAEQIRSAEEAERT